LIGFSAIFDPTFLDILLDDPQGLAGISQSLDASDGDFAVRMQGSYGVPTSDVFGVGACDEAPDVFSVDVKHVGESSDSLFIALVFDQGLNFMDEDYEIEDAPAFAFGSFLFDSDTEYQTIELDIIQSFAAPIDTFLFIIQAQTSDSTFFLIDNIEVDEATGGCDITAPTLSLMDDAGPVCVCNNLDVVFPLEYEEEGGAIRTDEVIIDENDIIVSVDGLFTNGFHDQFCTDLENLRAVLVAYEQGLEGLEVGLNINGLIGCFALSNTVEVETYFIPQFEFNVFNNGVEQPTDIELCLLDDLVEDFSFSTDEPIDNIAIFLVDEVSELVFIRLDDVNENITFAGMSPGEYALAAVSYDIDFNLAVGQDADDLSYSGCYSVSEDIYSVIILGEEDGCIMTDVEDSYVGNLAIQPNHSNGQFQIYNPSNESFAISIRDVSGRIIQTGNQENLGNVIDLSTSPNGVYFATFEIDGLLHQQKIVKING